MNGLLLVSILAAIFLTYKLITVLKNKEASKVIEELLGRYTDFV